LDSKGPLSDESKGLTHGELIRDYEPLPTSVWRWGKPNYAGVNKTYFQHRTMVHAEGSLESVVTKIVKNWQVESHHIADIHQWQTMDISKFKAALNGGCPCSAQLLADVGHSNMLLGETKNYSAAGNSFETSNKVFGAAFPEGFAWEVLEVFSGPPTVSFKWRHFGKYNGTFTDKAGKQYKGDGDMFNLIGLCLARVNEELKLESLDIYYNPEDMIVPLVTKTDKSFRAVGEDEADSKAGPVSGCSERGGCELM